MNEELKYFTQFGIMTDPKIKRSIFSEFPDDIGELVKIVQGLMVHLYWGEAYGFNIPEERKVEVQLRSVKEKLKRIEQISPAKYSTPRPVEEKLIGTCRDFAVLFVSILKAKGIPARARCGFGRYFTPGLNEDHWVCEYWNEQKNKWQLVDAQLDSLQKEKLNISFDPLDVPRDMFISGGDAWRMCRTKVADPENFGIFNFKGWMFILGNLFRDILSLCNAEILPWDGYGLMTGKIDDLKPVDYELLDYAAEMTEINNTNIPALHKFVEKNPILHLPDTILSYRLDGSFIKIDMREYN